MKVDKETKKLVAETMHDVHYWAGMALNAAQTLEYGCKFLLFLLSEQKLIDFSYQKAESIMEGEDKKTFGQILSMFRMCLQIDTEVESALRSALEERNWFIHSFYSSRSDELVTVAGRDSAISELKELRKKFNEANEFINRGIKQLMQLFYGVDSDDVSARAFELLLSKK